MALTEFSTSRYLKAGVVQERESDENVISTVGTRACRCPLLPLSAERVFPRPIGHGGAGGAIDSDNFKTHRLQCATRHSVVLQGQTIPPPKH